MHAIGRSHIVGASRFPRLQTSDTEVARLALSAARALAAEPTRGFLNASRERCVARVCFAPPGIRESPVVCVLRGAGWTGLRRL